jgi:predicted nuclease with TOPRIM domain
LAAENGLVEKEAKRLAEAFSDAGVILYLSNSSDPALAKIIHLKPERVSKALYHALDYHGLALANRMGELQQLKERFERMKDVKDHIDEKAHRSANRLIWLGGAYLIAQCAVLARFTWWEFSWDIVEPITYFVTFTGGLIGYLYFATTKSEYTYENLRDRLARTKREKWYKRANFDPSAFEELHKELEELQKDLKPYLGTTAISSAAAAPAPKKE